jgi:hypothetical protein
MTEAHRLVIDILDGKRTEELTLIVFPDGIFDHECAPSHAIYAPTRPTDDAWPYSVRLPSRIRNDTLCAPGKLRLYLYGLQHYGARRILSRSLEYGAFEWREEHSAPSYCPPPASLRHLQLCSQFSLAITDREFDQRAHMAP